MTLMALALALPHWVALQPRHYPWLVLLGALAAVGHLWAHRGVPLRAGRGRGAAANTPRSCGASSSTAWSGMCCPPAASGRRRGRHWQWSLPHVARAQRAPAAQRCGCHGSDRSGQGRMSRRSATVDDVDRRTRGRPMSNAEVRGRFIWHELLTTDTAAAAAFYAEGAAVAHPALQHARLHDLHGRSARRSAASWHCRRRRRTPPPHWLVYVGTPNVDATVTQAQGLGGAPVQGRHRHPERRPFRGARRSAGRNLRGLHPAAGGRAGAATGRAPSPGMSCRPLTSARPCASTASSSAGARGSGTTWAPWASTSYSITGARSVGGMCNTQGPSTPPSWLSYVHVADSNRAVAAAKAAGGRLLHGPIEVPGGSLDRALPRPAGRARSRCRRPRVR